MISQHSRLTNQLTCSHYVGSIGLLSVIGGFQCNYVLHLYAYRNNPLYVMARDLLRPGHVPALSSSVPRHSVRPRTLAHSERGSSNSPSLPGIANRQPLPGVIYQRPRPAGTQERPAKPITEDDSIRRSLSSSRPLHARLEISTFPQYASFPQSAWCGASQSTLMASTWLVASFTS